MRKQSISPPFNFQHVVHTAKQQLPPLETVEEKDLPGEFWSVSAYQRPRRHLHGIKADHLPRNQPEKPVAKESGSTQLLPSPPTRTGANLPPVTEDPLPSPNETTFDEATETRFDVDDGARGLTPEKQPLKFPKRYSSLNALQIPTQTEQNALRPPMTFYDSNSSNASRETEIDAVSPVEEADKLASPIDQDAKPISPIDGCEDTKGFGELEVRTVSPIDFNDFPAPPSSRKGSAGTLSETELRNTSALNPEETTALPVAAMGMANDERSRDIAYRSRQPLPPLPPQKSALQNSKRKPELSSMTSTSMRPMFNPSEPPVSPRSKRSSRSSRSRHKSPAFSSSSDVRLSTNLSDATWEEDVDFCYEQAAESTCDFNWNVVSRSQASSLTQLDTAQPSISTYHAHSPDIPNDSTSSLRYESHGDTITEQRQSQPKVRHKPGFSVGHRGFLAARKSSTDLSVRSNHHPAPIKISPEATQVSILSPVFSIADTDHEAQKSPVALGALQVNGVDGANLSDPESCRNSSSSRHLKSSSYGSYESTTRQAVPRPSKESSRWSVASENVPELMRSRPKSKTALSKNMISAPLETLVQSPRDPKEMEFEESTIVPRSSQTEPVRNSFLMRRPQTTSDRAVLQAAGRAVQRYRPSTPNGLSRLIQTPDPHESRGDYVAAGPAWI